ncbi:WD domain containing protein [Entamoeba marina]
MEKQQPYEIVSNFPEITRQVKTHGRSMYFHTPNKILFLRWINKNTLATCVENPVGIDVFHYIYLYSISPPSILTIYDFNCPIRDFVASSPLNKPDISKTDLSELKFHFIDQTHFHTFSPQFLTKIIRPETIQTKLPSSPVCLTSHTTLPLFLIGCVDGNVVVVNRDHQIVSIVKTHNAPINKICISQDVETAFICCAHGPITIKMHSLLSPHPLGTLPLHIFMSDMLWDGNSESPIIVGDSFGFISVIDKRTAAVKTKKQSTFSRIKTHQGGCNAVDYYNTFVFSAGDDGRAILFNKKQFDSKRKRDLNSSNIKVLAKAVKKDGVVELYEDLSFESVDGYVLEDDDVRMIDIKINPSLSVVAIAVRKGVVCLRKV